MLIQFLLWAAILGQPAAPGLAFRESKSDGRQVIATISEDTAKKLPSGRLTQEQGESILTIALVPDDTKKPGPAMLGKYDRSGNVLTFTPRFPFDTGRMYRATLHGSGQLDYRVPPAANQTPPKVVTIYPTSDVLPANQLRFYIYFDRPMRGGKEIFKQIALVDDKGKEISEPWLMDEIWDEENNCLIIYIHPGRIKWGVLFGELLGPVLHEKREYALVVRGQMAALDGSKLGADVVKKFRTTPEDRVRIDLGPWKLAAPKADSREPLVLALAKCVDHLGLQKYLTVTDDKGQRVEGKITLGKEEKLWHFTPTQPWHSRGYRVNVDARLEDVAGNTPARPFDLDLSAPKLPPQVLRFEFTPR